MTTEERIRGHLAFLYGEEASNSVAARLLERTAAFSRTHANLAPTAPLTQSDAVLITYGDQVSTRGELPLRTLGDFLRAHVRGLISTVHILPFSPYSGDDGFSVIDYHAVDPRLGTWHEVESIAAGFRLMADAVVNHVSRHSAWFRRYRGGDPAFANAFLSVPAGVDLSQVVRPRALPLLTRVTTVDGPKDVWTTFSTDQMDVNAADPDTLLRLIDVLLAFVHHGAQIIRLDAIAFLWKIIGTSCLHLEQTHRVVKLMRSVLDLVAPGVILITETNVPHRENISYFGDGTDEAQMVYQFPLPPLALYSLSRGDASVMTAWARGLELPSPHATFYNFTASHDGVGLRPLEGILPPQEVEWLAKRVLAHGGRVSYRSNPDGSQSPYELNVSYFDALSDPHADEPQATQVARMVCSQAMAMALQGLPALYFHSLFGSRNWQEGVARTGRSRSINREKLTREELEAALAEPATLRAQVFGALSHLLRLRAAEPSFHPSAPQEVLTLDPRVFAVRRCKDRGDAVLCLQNVSDQSVSIDTAWPSAARGRDLVAARRCEVADGRLRLVIEPYGVAWVKEER